MDTGIVSDEFGHLPEYREVTETPRGGQWALVEIEGSKGAMGRAPLGPNRIGLGLRVSAPSFLLPSTSFLPLLVGLGKGEPTPSRSRIPPLGRTDNPQA